MACGVQVGWRVVVMVEPRAEIRAGTRAGGGAALRAGGRLVYGMGCMVHQRQ